MRLNIKENLVFPLGDPSWLGKAMLWLVFYILGITAPILIGYHLETIRQAANGEDDRLPEFEGLWKMWKQGFIWYFMFACIWGVLGMLNGVFFAASMSAFDRPGPGEGPPAFAVVFLIIHLLIFLGVMVAAPASMLRYSMTEQARSVWDLKSLKGDIAQGIGDYAKIVLLPILGMFLIGLLAITGLGLLLVIPATPILAFAHARMVGNYYRLYFQ